MRISIIRHNCQTRANSDLNPGGWGVLYYFDFNSVMVLHSQNLNNFGTVWPLVKHGSPKSPKSLKYGQVWF